MHAHVESRCTNNAFEGCTGHLYVCICTYALCRKYRGWEMYPRRGSWGDRCCFCLWCLGPRALGIDMHGGFVMYHISRLAWCTWIDASSGIVQSTSVFQCIKMKQAGRAVDENEVCSSWSLQSQWLALTSKSVYPDPYPDSLSLN